MGRTKKTVVETDGTVEEVDIDDGLDDVINEPPVDFSVVTEVIPTDEEEVGSSTKDKKTLYPLRNDCAHLNSEVRNYDKDTLKGDIHCKDCAGYMGEYNGS